MAVTVRITETYDMKTTVNKLGLVAVHTPPIAMLNRLYPGLIKNYKFARILKADVVGACASVLPADPLQVGTEAGDVAPEDMFNPILYRAMTNEGFETILNRMYYGSSVNPNFGSVDTATIADSLDAFNIYYAFLGENKGWRKVMPQNGFNIRSLRPICYTMINTFGNQYTLGTKPTVASQGQPVQVSTTNDVSVLSPNAELSDVTSSTPAFSFRGRSVKMPRIPLHYKEEAASAGPNPTPVIPKIYVLGMLIPPARLHEFYYRMRVTWTIRFEGLISTNAVGTGSTISDNGYTSYTGPTYSSSKVELEHNENSVDTNGVELKKIMES